jgi:thiamine-monophosphate kinase
MQRKGRIGFSLSTAGFSPPKNSNLQRRSEVDLVQSIKRRAATLASPQLIEGIGDDCAVFRPRSGEDLVFTTDYLIEDVHFRRDTHSARDIGHKTLARGLSDIAAMGAEPRFALLSLALAPWTDDRWVDAFYAGFFALARKWNTPLAGGDLSHTDKLTCDIVVCGAVPRGKALRRDGARAGDAIYVSAPLGKPWAKHRRPEPRIDIGLALRGRATAAMDLTDGLALDLHRMCIASGLSAELDRVPVVRGSTLEDALHGGEDYELLFTIPPKAAPPDRMHRIGTMTTGTPGAIRLQGCPIAPRGYDHFLNDRPDSNH